MATTRRAPRVKRRPPPERDRLEALFDKIANVADSLQASMRSAPHHGVMVRLTHEQLRGMLEAALVSARQALVDADAALAAAVAKPGSDNDPAARIGPPPLFYERSAQVGASARVEYLEFALKHLAPGDVVTDAAHLHSLLAAPPSGVVIAAKPVPGRPPPMAH